MGHHVSSLHCKYSLSRCANNEILENDNGLHFKKLDPEEGQFI